MILDARTDRELVDAMNKMVDNGCSAEEVAAFIEESSLFLSEATDNLRFLYDNEDIFVVRIENHQRYSLSVIHLEYNYDVPHEPGYNIVWVSEMLDVSEADISRARDLLDEVSSADISRWRSTREFLQYIYSSAAYWVVLHIPEAIDTVGWLMEIALQRNGFDFEEEIRADDDIIVSYCGEVYTLSGGTVYCDHQSPFDDCMRWAQLDMCDFFH